MSCRSRPIRSRSAATAAPRQFLPGAAQFDVQPDVAGEADHERGQRHQWSRPVPSSSGSPAHASITSIAAGQGHDPSAIAAQSGNNMPAGHRDEDPQRRSRRRPSPANSGSVSSSRIPTTADPRAASVLNSSRPARRCRSPRTPAGRRPTRPSCRRGRSEVDDRRRRPRSGTAGRPARRGSIGCRPSIRPGSASGSSGIGPFMTSSSRGAAAVSRAGRAPPRHRRPAGRRPGGIRDTHQTFVPLRR